MKSLVVNMSDVQSSSISSQELLAPSVMDLSVIFLEPKTSFSVKLMPFWEQIVSYRSS